MYINEFWCGVGVTIIFEILGALLIIVFANWRNK